MYKRFLWTRSSFICRHQSYCEVYQLDVTLALCVSSMNCAELKLTMLCRQCEIISAFAAMCDKQNGDPTVASTSIHGPKG